MFSILKNHKPITLYCYTDDYSVYEYAKILKSSYFIPEWFKGLKQIEDNSTSGLTRTMRGCPGFIELFKKSFVYPMWVDLSITASESDQGEPQFFYDSAYGSDVVTSHGTFQYNNAFRPGFKHIKLSSPWFFETKEDLDWTIVPAFWNLESKVSEVFIPPAIDNYKRQHSTTWQMFIKTNNMPVMFNAGEPLVYLIPNTDKKVNVECVYDKEKTTKLAEKTKAVHFKKSYYKKQKMK